MKKCYIITAHIEGALSELVAPDESDAILCADGGYDVAVAAGFRPSAVIGDFDSMQAPVMADCPAPGAQTAGTQTPDAQTADGQAADTQTPGAQTADGQTRYIRHSAQKDESDTFLCVQYAIEQGCRDITIVGGLGGRLDHTVSNLQTLAHFSEKGRTIRLIDKKNTAAVITDGSAVIPRQKNRHLSLFSLSDCSTGVTTGGLRYALRDATLTNTYPIGLSNEFSAAEAHIEVRSGRLLVILSSD